MLKRVFNKLKTYFDFAVNYVKLLLAWVILHTFKRYLLKDNIWLVREKRDEARDNGYHFYKYLRQVHPEINAYYVITKSSPDREKVSVFGNIINADSIKHCIYFLAAEYSINSQPYGAFPFRFGCKEMNFVQKLCNPSQKVIFLQHGITKDTVSKTGFSYNTCNIDYFVCGAQREYEFIKANYGYPKGTIGCVGLSRFDNLMSPHTEENIILVMPTWRTWLGNKYNTVLQSDKERFLKSDYYKAYSNLMQDSELIAGLRQSGYKMAFYMHYKLQPYSDLFSSLENDVIAIADRERYDVQQLLMTSKVMITDFSSVFFDFAYMNKPVVYYQFDKEEYRKKHFSEGYFSYENDGFGPCVETHSKIKNEILKLLENGCKQPSLYEERVNAFFPNRDTDNCKRTFEAILELKK